MNDLTRCPVCHNVDGGLEFFQGYRRGGSFRIKCWVCGDFDVSEEAVEDYLENTVETRLTPLRRAALSYLVRCEQKPGGTFSMLKSALIERVIRDEIALPARSEQAERALRLIADEVRKTDKPLKHLPEHLYASIGAGSRDASARIVRAMVERGLLRAIDASSFDGVDFIEIEPTLDGWERVEGKEVTKAESRVAIVPTTDAPAIIVMKFNDPDLDNFVDNVVKAAVLEAGFIIERVSESPRVGLIDIAMREKLAAAPFVIAELTHHNKGAYWEAGFAEGKDVPVIYMCREAEWQSGQGTHFDTNHHETIVWRSDDPEAFRRRLRLILNHSVPRPVPTEV